jgi:hypothetical protein
LVIAIAEKYDVDPEALRNRIERAAPSPKARLPKPATIIEAFHQWRLKMTANE